MRIRNRFKVFKGKKAERPFQKVGFLNEEQFFLGKAFKSLRESKELELPFNIPVVPHYIPPVRLLVRSV